MPETKNIDAAAKIVWNYLQMHQPVKPADGILLMCSYDRRVPLRAAELYHQGYGKYILVSGGVGPTSHKYFTEPEAEVFAGILLEQRVPKDDIIIENQATNSGENIIFSHKLLQKLGKPYKSLIIVQKPYMERRTYATFRKQWPDPVTEIAITSPQLAYDAYFNEKNPKERVLGTMTGDMQRIREYPKLGFQIKQDIPDKVWQAYETLVAAGYTRRLLTAK